MSQTNPLHPTIAPRDRYDTWADSYDDRTSRFKWSAPQFLLSAVVRCVPPTGSLRVLDIGVGTGQVSVPYLEAGAGVTGLDVSPGMLCQARAKWPQFHALIEHDFNRPLAQSGLQARSFDVVLSCGALHFAKDLEKTLAELKWVLAPGGLLAFTYIPPQLRTFSAAAQQHEPTTVERMLCQLGLTIWNHEPFVAYYDAGNPDDPVLYERILARCCESALPMPAVLQDIDRTACVDRSRLLYVADQPLMVGALTTQWTDDLTSIRAENQCLVDALVTQLEQGGEVEPKQLPLPGITAKSVDQGMPGCDVFAIIPHPDDESIYAGGTIGALSEAGQRVRLVVATDGAAGRGGADSERVQERANELRRAADILGIEQVDCWGLADFGKYRDRARTQPTTSADALRTWGLDRTIALIVRSIRLHRPRVLLTLHPEVDPNYSLHGHHLGLGVAVLVAFHLAADPGFVAPDAPELPPWAVEEHRVMVPQHYQSSEVVRIEIDRERKLRALYAYETQHYSTKRLIEALQTGAPNASFEFVQVLQARSRQHQVTVIPLSSNQKARESALDRDWLATYNTRRQRCYPRNALADLLRHQAEIWGASKEVLINIERLRTPETVAVVTGQQVGILGGPVYTLYKALGAVQLARHLEAQGIPAVPVFWMASYDHDLDEVQQVKLLANRTEPQTLGLGLPAKQCPVGSMQLGAEIHALLDEVERSGQLPHSRETIAELRAAYQPGATFTTAFARWLSRLTKQLGLVILDPATSEFAHLARDVVESELFGAERSQIALDRTRQTLAATGRSETIPTDRSLLQMFYVDPDGIRRRLRRIEGGFALQQSDVYLTDDAARNLLEQQPERFTPSALLRPICQDAVLPTIAYVAGPTEQKYFAQLQEVYAWAEMPMPQIVARPSFTVIDGIKSDLLASAGGTVTLLNRDDAGTWLGQAGLPESVRLACSQLSALQQQIVALRASAIACEPVGDAAQALKQDVEQWLSETAPAVQSWGAKRPLEALARATAELPSLVATVCSDLSRSGNRGNPPPTRSLSTLAQAAARLESTLIREGRRQNASAVAAFAYVSPNGANQDRHLSVGELIATHGFSIMEHLLAISFPDRSETRLMTVRHVETLHATSLQQVKS